MRNLFLLIVLFLALAGCEETTVNNPAAPPDVVFVTVAPATNCSPTTTPGEVKVTDESQPSGAIDRVTGNLFNANGADVCSWSISREGNLSGSATCNGLLPGSYTFEGNIILNTGQGPTPVSGGCTVNR